MLDTSHVAVVMEDMVSVTVTVDEGAEEEHSHFSEEDESPHFFDEDEEVLIVQELMTLNHFTNHILPRCL